MKKEDVYRIFSAGFSAFEDRNGFDHKDVAKILDISDASVSTMRSGKTLPRFDKVFTLVEHGMRLEEVFGAELAEKLTAGLEPVHVDGKPDAFDTPEFRKGVADAIAVLMSKGVTK